MFLKYVKLCAMTIFGSVLSLSLIPIVIPLFIIFYVLTLFVTLLIKVKYGTKAVKATGTDVLSGKETEESRPIINVAFRFLGKLNTDKFRSRILDVLMHSIDAEGRQRYKRLTQIYCREFGYHVWKDAENFNIDHHIKIIKLEDLVYRSIENELAREDWDASPTNIEELKCLTKNTGNIDWQILTKCLMNEVGAEKLNNEIPQWQLLLLKENDDRYTALFRFHHAIADGIYVSRMLCEDFLDSPMELFHSYIPPSRLQKWLLDLWSFCLLPFGLWKILKNNDKNVLHGTKLSGKKKYYLSKSVSLDMLKRIRQSCNVSIHGILFSCLSTAIASHFKRRSTVTVKGITALIPMPLQNLQKPIKLRNKFAVVSLKLPTPPPKSATTLKGGNYTANEQFTNSSLSRLSIIKNVLEEAKADPTFLSVHSLITLFCSFLPASVAESLLSAKGCSFAFSNLPGPQTEICFWNDRIEEIMFWIPDRDPLGAGLSILSYNGHLRAGLALDEALIEDEREGNLFVQDFENEIDNLLKELSEVHISDDAKCESSDLLKTVP